MNEQQCSTSYHIQAHTCTQTNTYLYVGVDKVLGPAAVDPVSSRDLLLFWNVPCGLQPVTVEPDQDLTVHVTAGPTPHLGKLRDWGHHANKTDKSTPSTL